MNRVSRRAVLQQFFLTPLLAASPKLDTIIYRIVRAEVFAFGGVGFTLELSQEELCYRVLLTRPSAAEDFETVFATGNAQATCYALVGFRQVNRKRFNSLAALLHSSKIPVAIMRGCGSFHQPMSALIQQIESGIYSGPLTRNLVPPPEQSR